MKKYLVHLVFLCVGLIFIGLATHFYLKVQNSDEKVKSIDLSEVRYRDTLSEKDFSKEELISDLTKSIIKETKQEESKDYTNVIGMGVVSIISFGFSLLGLLNTRFFTKVEDGFAKVHEKLIGFEDLIVRKSVEDQLRSVIRSYSRMAPCTQIKSFVDTEGERLMTIVEEIMTDNLTLEIYNHIVVKIDTAIDESRSEARRSFGENFYIPFCEVQNNSTNRLKDDLRKIVETEGINHKYERFKSACESFLHDHLVNVVTIYIQNKVK